MILFYLLILSLPLVDHPQFGYAIYGVTVEKFLGVACFFFALCYLPSRKLFPQFLATAQARIFVAFTAMAMGSYVLMVTPFDWHEMVGNIFTELIFFMPPVFSLIRANGWRTASWCWLPPLASPPSILIKEWAVVAPVYGLSYRPGSVAGDPNVFSASAVTVLPIMVAFAFGRNGWKRVFCGICLLLTMVAILLASSRGAFFALVVLLLLQMRNARHRGKHIVIAIVIVALFIASPISPLDRLLHPTRGRYRFVQFPPSTVEHCRPHRRRSSNFWRGTVAIRTIHAQVHAGRGRPGVPRPAQHLSANCRGTGLGGVGAVSCDVFLHHP